jgi:uncharacterized membrane protein YfcA
MLPWIWLGLCILISSTVEAITGFGSIVIALSLGALLLPIAGMLPVLVPLNIFMTGTIAWKNRHHIDRAFLLKLVLPLMAAGTMAGYFLRPWLGESLLKMLLGALIIWFASRELWRLIKHVPSHRHPPWLSRILTFGAGITHGLFASGGPLLVYAMAGKHLDKGSLRATLVTVWFSLNLGLTVAFLIDRTLIPALPRVAMYLPVLATGYFLGEFLHHRLDERRFRQLVYVMLILTGLALIVR